MARPGTAPGNRAGARCEPCGCNRNAASRARRAPVRPGCIARKAPTVRLPGAARPAGSVAERHRPAGARNGPRDAPGILRPVQSERDVPVDPGRSDHRPLQPAARRLVTCAGRSGDREARRRGDRRSRRLAPRRDRRPFHERGRGSQPYGRPDGAHRGVSGLRRMRRARLLRAALPLCLLGKPSRLVQDCPSGGDRQKGGAPGADGRHGKARFAGTREACRDGPRERRRPRLHRRDRRHHQCRHDRPAGEGRPTRKRRPIMS